LTASGEVEEIVAPVHTKPDSVGPASTLLDLFRSIPPERTAIVIPERQIRVTYGGLRTQVKAAADVLAAAGVGRDDRVGIAVPRGLLTIVCFLAASLAGTAAPLNPAYKEEEFRFYLTDTAARVLILPRDGAEDARRAAGDAVKILTADMDPAGTVHLSGTSRGPSVVPPSVDDVALILHTSGSTARPKRVPLTHANLSISARTVARTYRLVPTMCRCASCRCSTCTASSHRRSRRSPPAARWSCLAGSVP
jgi:acyl-CoA synthetase (AMP-forming)/AMP-acid ligase II